MDVPVPPVRVKRVGRSRDKFFYVLPAAITFGPPSFYFNTTLKTLLAAIETRVLNCYDGGVPLPPLVPGRDAWALNDYSLYLIRCASRMTPISLASSCASFTGPRQAAYKIALANLQTRGFKLSDMTLSDWLKSEAYDKMGAYPRVIRNRSPEANIVFGMVARPLHALKGSINAWFKRKFGFAAPIILSGADRPTLARYAYTGIMSVGDYVILRLDGVKLDFHVEEPQIRWTQRIYRACARLIPDPVERSWVAFFLARRLRREKNVATVPGYRVTFTTPPRRATGDDDTWLGNTLVVSKFVEDVCTALQRAGCVSMYASVTSDDVGLVIPKSFLKFAMDLIPEAALWFGLRFRVETVSSAYQDYSWMQSHLLHDGRRLNYVRDLRRTLRRALVTDQTLDSESVRASWLCAVGIGGLIECGSVPVLRQLYLSCLIASRGATPMALRSWDQETMTPRVADIIARERLSDGYEAGVQRCARPNRLVSEARVDRFKSYFVEPDPTFAVEYYRVCNVTPELGRHLEEWISCQDLMSPETAQGGDYDLATRHLSHLFLGR